LLPSHSSAQQPKISVHNQLQAINNSSDDKYTHAVVYLSLPTLPPEQKNTLLTELLSISNNHMQQAEILHEDIVGILQSTSNKKLGSKVDHMLALCHAHFKVRYSHKLNCTIGACLLDENLDTPEGLIYKAKYAAENHGSYERPGIYCATTDDNHLRQYQEAQGLEEYLKEHLNSSFQTTINPLHRIQNNDLLGEAIWPSIPQEVSSQWTGKDITRAPMSKSTLVKLDQILLLSALGRIKSFHNKGKYLSVFVPMSNHSITDESFSQHLINELRQRHQVGTGLVFEYKVSDTSKEPEICRKWFDKLKGLDIKVSLYGMSATDSAIKLVRYLKVDFVNFNSRLTQTKMKTVEKTCEVLRNRKISTIITYHKNEDNISQSTKCDYYLMTK
jgi:hypothetical protein